MEQNESFIANTCEICGGSDMGYALSELHLICGYGSKNDGEEIRLALCGECADRIFEHIQNISVTESENRL